MPDTVWIETHQARTREIRGDWIVGKNDLPEMPVSSVQRPVAFHRDHPIRDNEVDRRRGADVENAAMDPLPVEKVFRPAILAPRHNAKHVLHAERDSGPMVRFDLGH
jgi:hypothetical protein